MSKKLSFKDYLYVGSMLFGLFFGAGNLIFPVHMGQQAGANIFTANLGFLITGIGLPFLGVIAIGISKSNGVFDLAKRINHRYAVIFTVLLYLTIGPFFALPRLATTSYEIGVSPFINNSHGTIALAVFSILFFSVAWYFSRKPSKLIGYIGKFLNPLFLFFLFILVIMAFVSPLGDVSTAAVSADYSSGGFIKGFVEGYNTLDALASLAFGIIIVSTIREMGVEKPAEVAKDTIKSGTVSIVLMGLIYTLLAYMGTMSLGKFPLSSNGGITLAQIAKHYLGTYGSILLAFIVILACLKTAIGLITSFSETFVELFPKLPYAGYIIIASVLPGLFANVGLTNIIQFSVPVLMLLYPLAITLILLVIFSPLFGHRKAVYQGTTYFTLVAAVIDALNNSPSFIRSLPMVKHILDFSQDYLPLFSIGMGWLIFALVGFTFGLLWSMAKKVQNPVV